MMFPGFIWPPWLLRFVCLFCCDHLPMSIFAGRSPIHTHIHKNYYVTHTALRIFCCWSTYKNKNNILVGNYFPFSALMTTSNVRPIVNSAFENNNIYRASPELSNRINNIYMASLLQYRRWSAIAVTFIFIIHFHLFWIWIGRRSNIRRIYSF